MKKREKGPSLLSRLGARLSRAFSGGQTTEPSDKEQKDDAKEEVTSPASEEPRPKDALHPVEETDEEKEGDDEEREEVILPRDTFYSMSAFTKTGHDKVILELSAIAKNAKLVAKKAEALKSARLQEEDSSSGERTPTSGVGKSLSRRDSELNIEQAAENLRTTLKNLSEAELLEIKAAREAEQKAEEELLKAKLQEELKAKTKKKKKSVDESSTTKESADKESDSTKGKDEDTSESKEERPATSAADDKAESKTEPENAEDEKNETDVNENDDDTNDDVTNGDAENKTESQKVDDKDDESVDDVDRKSEDGELDVDSKEEKKADIEKTDKEAQLTNGNLDSEDSKL